jgi:hypothetical protein
VRATFFVEALQTAYFGDEPMGGMARRIGALGHDVQLHLHPCWLHYESPEEGRPRLPTNDSCAGRTDAELDRFFQYGLSVFSRWGLPRPLAVRSGNFEVDAAFYRAAERSGLNLSSSVAPPNRHFLKDSIPLGPNRYRIGHVLELPISTYTYNLGGKQRPRMLIVTACSYTEIESVLQQAYEYQISPVIIMTHPHEYIKRKDAHYTKLPWARVNQARLKRALQYAELRRNRLNQGRLRAVLQLLSQAQDKFITVPISAISGDVANDAGMNGIGMSNDAGLSVSFDKAIARMFQNGINDRIWRF